ncbi:hypothetical protein ACFYU5_04625 [Nocardia aobensis]|uniref:DUF1837 domain-containing protein n=1 Tax=Nocardia aobensis TaxID=257277 RepID=A0ABW6NX44_9NOCA
MTSPAGLTPLLALVDSPATSKVEYVTGGTTLTGRAREAAAQLLADDAVSLACGASPVVDLWRARRDGGPSATGSSLRALETFVKIAFKLPGEEPNKDHLQGHVAELLWNRLIQERAVCRDGRKLVKAHAVKVDPLEPGGDGLVIYSDCSDTLVFRLWEIKKHDKKVGISATINTASKQLSERGSVYLAKLAAPESMTDDAALGQLYANMVEMWFDRSERVGVGISVGTSATHVPKSSRTFGSLKKQFPEFGAAQTEGIVVAVPDFPGFAERVQEIVWSGL